MKTFLLIFVLLTSLSCAYRTKGIAGINKTESLNSSIGLASNAEFKYPAYVREKQREELRFFPVDDNADFVIKKIDYDRAPPAFMCGTGLPIPFLISFLSLGIIPLHLTAEMSGRMEVISKSTGKVRTISFQAKETSSWSIWNRMKVGRDPEWSRKDQARSDYYKKFLESKILR